MDIKPWIIRHIIMEIRKYNIDDSHGLTHLIGTRRYALVIMNTLHGELVAGMQNAAARELILDAAVLHDLVDKKYVEPMRAVESLRDAFNTASESSYAFDDLVEIITSVSFSLRSSRVSANLPQFEKNKLTLAKQIVADADQLEAYNPARCFAYAFYTEQPTSHALSLLRNRVLKYRDNWMCTAMGKSLACDLHRSLEEFLDAL